MDIDKWAAGKCQVLIHNYVNFQPKSWEHRKSKAVGFGEWTMQDARCREIVREHFMLATYPCTSANGTWTSESQHVEGYFDSYTIAESEIACIRAIMQADDGHD